MLLDYTPSITKYFGLFFQVFDLNAMQENII